MSDNDAELYQRYYRQLSRIATYQMQKQLVLLCLFVIAVVVVGLYTYGYPFGALGAGGFLLFNLILRLWVKHRLICPKCKGPFFGEFKILSDYTRTCRKCGLSFVRNHNQEVP